MSTTWAPIDLGPLLDGGQLGDPPAFLRRSDDVGLLYRGKLHALSGEPEAGKGWLALHAAVERLTAFEHVLYLDFEDSPATIVARLLALGAGVELIREHFHYARPDEPLSPAANGEIRAALEHKPTLAVVDGITEALAVHGLDLRDNTDVAKFLALLPRPLAATGAAVVLVDHVVKDREARGRYAIGAQHKLAGVDVAYTLEALEPFGRGRDGLSRLTVHKDRPGYLRQHTAGKAIAELAMRSAGDTVALELRAPAGAGTDEDAPFRPTVLMERVSLALEATPRLSKRALRDAVRGRASYVDTALEFLILEGHVTRDHDVTTPYRVDDDQDHRVPVSAPCPERVPDTGGSDRVPVSSPVGDTDTGHGTQDELPDLDRVPTDDELINGLVAAFDAQETDQ